MLASLAIATLGLAVANDEGDGDASVEEQFRVLYALGDKAAAYRCLFATKESFKDAHFNIASARRDVLMPLLFRLTEQMQSTKTLEDLRAILEEIDVVLLGWSLWKWSSWNPIRGYRAGLSLFDIIGRRERSLVPGQNEANSLSSLSGERRSPSYQALAWSNGSAAPSATADTPIFIDLTELLSGIHPTLERNAWRLRAQARLLGWDRDGRVLSVSQMMGSHGFITERFEIQSIEYYLSLPF